MRKFVKAVILILLLMPMLSVKVKAASVVSINDLIEHAKELDGREVIIEGEPIGEKLERGDYSWINVNDKTNAIGIWIDTREAGLIKYYGDYKNIGDTVRITGVFHRACTEHGGEADIHGSILNVTALGYPVKEQISIIKVTVTIPLMTAALLISLYFVRLNRKRA